jgi:hypothetical protein
MVAFLQVVSGKLFWVGCFRQVECGKGLPRSDRKIAAGAGRYNPHSPAIMALSCRFAGVSDANIFSFGREAAIWAGRLSLILGYRRLEMNKNVIIAAIVALAAAGGYYQFSYAPAQKAAAEATAAADAAAAAAKAAEEATAAAAAEAEAAAAAAAEEATAAAAAAVPALDAATFDATAVAGLIDASALDDATKATLKAAVTAAGADPAAITAVIAQVKTALGM